MSWATYMFLPFNCMNLSKFSITVFFCNQIPKTAMYN